MGANEHSGIRSDDDLYNALADYLAGGSSLEDALSVVHDFLRDLRDGTVAVELSEGEDRAVNDGLKALEPWSNGETTDPEDGEDEGE
jgi:hypothetical protein